MEATFIIIREDLQVDPATIVAEEFRRRPPEADPIGCPGGDDVSRQQGHDRGDARHQILHRADEVLCVGGLAALAVDVGLEVDAVGIDVGGDARPHRAEAVEGFGPCRLPVAHLEVPRRDVVEARITEHVLTRPLGVVDSGLPGPKGNREFLVHLTDSREPTDPDELDRWIDDAVG